MTALHYLTVAEASQKLRNGEVTSADLVEASLARIEETDGALNAVITLLADEARAAAAQADGEIADKRWRGPLHGIPIGLKDIYSTAGVRTTCHSRLLAENVPAEDAETVARLKAAGAIVVAKLATHEFAFGGPSYDLAWPPARVTSRAGLIKTAAGRNRPPARNPWNPEHVPGGSSSGSGAAVAAGLCAAAMGSDTGGSIRSPAGLCGIVGLKPSYGRLSRRGIYPLSWTQDHAGPMTRTVEDCALMMQALAGYDPLDPASVDAPVPDFAAALKAPVAGLRLGIARSWYAEAADAETCALIDGAADALRGAGLEVRDIDLPDVRDFHACGRIVILAEAYGIHRPTLAAAPEKYGQFFRDRVRLGAFVSAADYLAALRMRRTLTDATLAAMAKAKVDVLLTANQYGPAEPFADSQTTFPFFKKPYLTMPFNVTGMPALTVCAGFASNGLPIGAQLAARPFEDDALLAVGHAYETARGDLGRRPPV
jgi:aspartyl-tRNA(Asn)/glutamyl-tRNA(Gln) amidotransferase subunit A